MTQARVIVNVVAFQVAWLAAVGSAAASRAWLGIAIIVVLAVAHLAAARSRIPEVVSLLAIGTIGGAWDSLPVTLGIIEYAGPRPAPGVAPYWIFALWVAFATTVNVALRWLRGRVALGMLIGAVAGPLCYLGGEALGALRFGDRYAALAAQSAAWAVLLPLCSWLAARFDGFAPTPRQAHV
jgi:hypothetical protein